MVSITKNFFVLVNIFIFVGFLNSGYLAETKRNSIINLFCLEYFKEEMLKANLDYDQEIANDTCDCYLEEFSNSNSHKKALKNCKLETKEKFNL